MAVAFLARDADARAETAGMPTDGPESAAHDEERVRFELHVDVVPFINHGFAAWAGVKPPGQAHWTFGAGLFEFRQQAALTRLIKPSNDGITVEKLSAAAVARYYFLVDPIPHAGEADTSARGLFASAYVGYLRKTVSFAGAEAGLDELFITVDVGYRFFPAGKLFYLQPSVGLEANPLLHGDGTLGTRGYGEGIVEPIVFFGVGLLL